MLTQTLVHAALKFNKKSKRTGKQYSAPSTIPENILKKLNAPKYEKPKLLVNFMFSELERRESLRFAFFMYKNSLLRRILHSIRPSRCQLPRNAPCYFYNRDINKYEIYDRQQHAGANGFALISIPHASGQGGMGNLTFNPLAPRKSSEWEDFRGYTYIAIRSENQASLDDIRRRLTDASQTRHKTLCTCSIEAKNIYSQNQ